MPLIKITEQDLTKTGGTAEDFDVVYIPGLVDTAQSCLIDKEGNYIGLEANKPTLFTTVAEFVALCGKKAAKFETDQYYSDLNSIGTGFKDSAIPYHRTMLPADSYDPSYIMAKELLNAGLCVLYERINGDTSYETLQAQPDDWDTNYQSYYTDVTSKERIESVSAPEFVKDKYFKEVKTIVDTVTTVEYEALSTKPADWDTRFFNYFEDVARKANVPASESGEAPTFDSATFYTVNDGINLVSIYKALEGVYSVDGYDGLQDLGNYSVKYLTSGGYPTYEYNGNSIVSKMIALSEQRGDCVAFIDHTDNQYRQNNIDLPGSVYNAVKNDTSLKGNTEFATMFTPHATYNRTTVDHETSSDGTSTVISKNDSLRGSGTFAYLAALADSIKTNAPWLAVAGATRGVVLNLAQGGITTVIPNGAADAMQPRIGVSVNAITDIKPYGNVIWGNRTLKTNGENLTATSFLNIRNLVSDVKKLCYRTARKLTYEQNNDILWINFKAEIAPTLDRMLSGYGISGYKFVRDKEHENANEKATLCAKIVLYPVYPVEDFYITIVLEDDEISVE